MQMYYDHICNSININDKNSMINLDVLKTHIFIEKLINVSEEQIFSLFDCEILIKELRYFSNLLENITDINIIFYYIENGLIKFMKLMLAKILCSSYKLSGKNMLKVYEIVVLFLKVKMAIVSNNLFKENANTMKNDNIDKINQHPLLNKNIYLDEKVEELKNDIFDITNEKFIIIDYMTILEKAMKNLKDLDYDYKLIMKNRFRIKTIKSDNTIFEEADNFLKFKNFYEEMKNQNISQFYEYLGENNLEFEAQYKVIFLEYLNYFIQNPEDESELNSTFSRSANYLLKFLKIDTDNTQKEIFRILKLNVYFENKNLENNLGLPNKSQTFFKNILEKLIKNFICVIFNDFNPTRQESSVEKDTLTYILILKFLCENHNTYFQTIFMKEIYFNISEEINPLNESKNQQNNDISIKSQKKKISLFDMFLLMNQKIILLSDWPSDDIPYYFEIFLAVNEFLIEVIQGTKKENFNIFLSKKKGKVTYNTEYEKNDDNDKDQYYQDLPDFLIKIRGLIFNNSVSEFSYKIKKELVNFLLAFLEEKNCPFEVKNIIICTFQPIEIMFSISRCLKAYLKKKNFPNLIDLQSYKFLLDDYYFGDFGNSFEFCYSNNLYRYLKIIATEFSVKEAINIINKDLVKNNLVQSIESDIYYSKKFFEEITKIISIKFQDSKNIINHKSHDKTETQNVVVRIIFTIHPKIVCLSSNTKKLFFEEADRSNRYKKINHMLDNIELFKSEIDYNYNLNGRKFLKYCSEMDYLKINTLIFLFNLGINIFLMCVVKVDKSNFRQGSQNELILFTLDLCFVFIVFICTCFWFYGKYSLFFQRQKKIYLNKYKLLNLNIFDKLIVITKSLDNLEVLQLIWNLVFGVLSSFNSELYFLHSLNLLSIVALSETLQIIVVALKIRWQILLKLFSFCIFVIYCFSNIEYYFNKHNYYFKNELKGYSFNECDGIGYCWLTHFYIAILKPSTTQKYENHPSFVVETTHYIGKFIFEITIFIIMRIILLNIIFGIIIDAYRELRLKLNLKENDKSKICYICGASRDSLEKKNENFNYHCEIKHNIWNYIYYMIGLTYSDPHDLNANNSYIYEKLIEKNIDWIPDETNEYSDSNSHSNEIHVIEEIDNNTDSNIDSDNEFLKSDENQDKNNENSEVSEISIDEMIDRDFEKSKFFN